MHKIFIARLPPDNFQQAATKPFLLQASNFKLEGSFGSAMIASVMMIRESTPGRIAPMPREAPMGAAGSWCGVHDTARQPGIKPELGET
jgi:hypothetical protein